MRFFGKQKKRVAIIKIEGIIADGDTYGASRSKIISALKEAERKNARSIILRLNTPGGSVAACQEIFASIKRLKEKGMPVVASMGDVAASGGVYLSMAADCIFANPGTVTGSIGVIIKSNNLSLLYEKVGISPKVVKSGPHKDMLATYRSFSSDEEELLQGVINDSHDQFVEIVAASRSISEDKVRQIADGRILTGRQALKCGLIDTLGDLEDACMRAASLAGITGKPDILLIQPRKGFIQKLLSPLTGLGQTRILSQGAIGIPLWLMPNL